jgi:hypothetical protein
MHFAGLLKKYDMNNEEKYQRHNDEIDLLYFLKPVTTPLKKAAHLATAYFRRLWTNLGIFFIIVVLGVIAGFCIQYFSPKGYKSSAIFSSRGLHASFCSILLNNLNSFVGKGNNIAPQLNIGASVAGTIKSLEATPLIDTFYNYKRDSSITLFTVTLVTTSNTSINEIQTGLINFLENNEYAKKRKEARSNSLRALNNDNQQKLKSLDSLKKLVNSSVVPRSNGQGIILGEPVNPVDVYTAESEYYENILKNNEELAVNNNIEMLQPFLIPAKFNYPDRTQTSLLIILISILLALIIIPFVGKKR